MGRVSDDDIGFGNSGADALDNSAHSFLNNFAAGFFITFDGFTFIFNFVFGHFVEFEPLEAAVEVIEDCEW